MARPMVSNEQGSFVSAESTGDGDLDKCLKIFYSPAHDSRKARQLGWSISHRIGDRRPAALALGGVGEGHGYLTGGCWC